MVSSELAQGLDLKLQRGLTVRKQRHFQQSIIPCERKSKYSCCNQLTDILNISFKLSNAKKNTNNKSLRRNCLSFACNFYIFANYVITRFYLDYRGSVTTKKLFSCWWIGVEFLRSITLWNYEHSAGQQSAGLGPGSASPDLTI